MSEAALDIIGRHVVNPGGQHDGWWACMCGGPWNPQHVLDELRSWGLSIVEPVGSCDQDANGNWSWPEHGVSLDESTYPMRVVIDEPYVLTPVESRELAAVLLSAAKEAEK